jgi:hypothetical protein
MGMERPLQEVVEAEVAEAIFQRVCLEVFERLFLRL